MIPKIGPTELPPRDERPRHAHDAHTEPFTIDDATPPTRDEAPRHTRRSERVTADYPAVHNTRSAPRDAPVTDDGLDDADTDLDLEGPAGEPVALAVPLDAAALDPPVPGRVVAVAAEKAGGGYVWTKPGSWTVPGSVGAAVTPGAAPPEAGSPSAPSVIVDPDAESEPTLARPQADPRAARSAPQQTAGMASSATPQARVTPQAAHAGDALAGAPADPATSEVLAGAGRVLADMGPLLRQTLAAPRRQPVAEPARPELAAATADAGNVDAARAAAQKVTAVAGAGLGSEVAEALRNLGRVDGPTVLHLHSAEVGRFSAVVRLDGGELFVSLRADDAQTRALLDERLDDVRRQLDAAGVQAAGVDVSSDGGHAREDAPDEQEARADLPPRRRIIPKRARPQAPPRPRSGTHLDLLV